ncbi:MAG: MFS transporter [Phycisphaerales bacterium]|nr:MFS transporter [Phycisphaerales bacterium]
MINATTTTIPSPSGLKTRLSAMMFLQYAIWGAWLPLLWPYLKNHLHFGDSQIGNLFALGAVGAICAPWVAGQIADRYFNTEKYLAMCHIIGGILVWQLGSITTYEGFFWFSLLYSIIYSPTLSLTNSLSFHHLTDRDRDFGKVRVWGTVGWVVVGITIGQWLLRTHTPVAPVNMDEAARATYGAAVQVAHFAGMADAFKLSGVLGVVMGLYCLTLPATPPSQGARASAVREAIDEVRKAPLVTLFMLAVPVSCIHQFYFVHTAGFLGTVQQKADSLAQFFNDIFGVGGGGLMTIGQICEIAVLGFMPVLAVRFTRKQLLAAGLVAYGLRMALFAYFTDVASMTGLPEILVVVTGVALHGFCFGCFIFVAFLIVDEECTGDVRASAQSLFNLVIVGFGIIVGSKIASGIATMATSTVEGKQVTDYTTLFSIPMWGSLFVLLMLIMFYMPGRKQIPVQAA